MVEKTMKELTKSKIRKIQEKYKENNSIHYLREKMEIIGEESRLAILTLLTQKPYFLSDLAELLEKTQASTSHHLRLLEQAELIYSSKKGKYKEYSLARENFTKLLSIWRQWFQAIRFRDYPAR